MNVITDESKIQALFERGIIVDILPSKEQFIERLKSGKRLRIYHGVDPVASTLHLSHAKNFMVLEQLRQLGHEVIVLFGDFTARIGDPDKKSVRKQLSEEEVGEHVKLWRKQIDPLIDFNAKDNPARIAFNSAWLSKLSLADVIKLSANFTVQQMLERDMFQKRMNQGDPVWLHEFMYPLLQGFDSVELDVDAELCGTDQTFNALAGRTLMKRLKDKEKFVIINNLMENPKTGEVMSKSKGIGVFLNTTAFEMFGAIMAEADEMIEVLFRNCTRLPMLDMQNMLDQGPKEAKFVVAFDIVKRFFGEDVATKAKQEWEDTFSKGGLPDEIIEINAASDEALIDALLKAKIVPSKTEWGRLISETAVKILDRDGTEIERIEEKDFKITKPLILKIGKKRFIKILLENK
ncbi:MAG: tyrosine--tRNA ligase [Minisyncoccia bacterium]